MKCSSCKKNLETTFLDKIKGAYLVKGKEKKQVCNECQAKGIDYIKKHVKF